MTGLTLKHWIIFLSATLAVQTLAAQDSTELNSGWICHRKSETLENGEQISKPGNRLSGWLPATVPGTVLTTLLQNRLVPDPFYGMNNEKIPDIYTTGREYYTYWFVKDFDARYPSGDELLWLHFRGVNYGCDVYLNGHRLNEQTHYGMFLRQTYNITPFLANDGHNRLAVIVYPPDPVGDPNGGQGGDGTIARNVSHQYVAGWDWIQPIRDRNTGIWDQVTLERTRKVDLRNPHVITLVPGKRYPDRNQEPAVVRATAELNNPSSETVTGTLQMEMAGIKVQTKVALQPHADTEVSLPDLQLSSPRLWWPNGYGEQYLYDITFSFIDAKGETCDREKLKAGVREIQTVWNDHTRSMQALVNGQKIFIKGGNWIVSDAMLRLSAQRYDAEIRFHRDMNLNLIRIWGGALSERPEFYDACDRYGILVFQDFWMSGDCNGRWMDTRKKDDQWTRRKYPDDHQLFLASVADQVKMIRNHPSLAFYCGGNEIPPPEDILTVMQRSLLPKLDGTRYFFTYSNTDSMSYNSTGGNGDGPYSIQTPEFFWEQRSFPFNSEIGSVGMGDIESLQRFIPEGNLFIPGQGGTPLDSVWRYHKYSGYGKNIEAYGTPTSLKDFADKAQLVNFDQYRALIEGHSAHMWDWYTGVIIWKTQNPWTALRGQMYDYYLDPNACLYGLHHGSEPLHVMCSPTDGMVMVVNNTCDAYHDLMLRVKSIDADGKPRVVNQVLTEVSPTSVQKYFSVKSKNNRTGREPAPFVLLQLVNSKEQVLSENLYWWPDSSGNYAALQKLPGATIKLKAVKAEGGKIVVTLSVPADGPMAFFNRVSLLDKSTGKRILPVFYSDNYISVMPGEEKKVDIEYGREISLKKAVVSLRGWNVEEQEVPVE